MTPAERRAVGAQFMVHRAHVLRWVRALGVHKSEATDAAQDVFLVAVSRWHDYQPSEPLGGWLYGIARGVASNWRRTRRRRPVELWAVYDDIGVRSHEERAIARAELAALPEHMAPLLHALAENGFMLRPAARDLNVDEDTIRVRLVGIRRGEPVEPLIPRPKRRARTTRT